MLFTSLRLLLLSLFDMSDHDSPAADPREKVVQFDHDEEAADAAAPDELSSGGPKAGQPLAYGGAQARQSHAAGSRPGEVCPSSITNDPGSRSTTRSTMRRQLTLTLPPPTGSRSGAPRHHRCLRWHSVCSARLARGSSSLDWSLR